jgi:hypothetical protein
MLQAIEAGTEKCPPNTTLLPTSAFVSSAGSCCTHSHAALQAYLHACFNAHTSAALLSALLSAQDTVVADNYHAWAPLRGKMGPLEELVATLEQLDAAHRCFILPQSVHACEDEDACGHPGGSCGNVHADANQFEVHATDALDEEPHACTDADTSKYDDYTFDVPAMHAASSLLHASGSDSNAESPRSTTIPAVALLQGFHASPAEGADAPAAPALADSTQQREDLLSSPPAMESFGSFDPIEASVAPCRAAVEAPLDSISASQRVHDDHASSQPLSAPCRTSSPTVRAALSICDRDMNASHGKIDAGLLQQPTASAAELSMHEVRPIHAHEPTLPCSSYAATFPPVHLLGSRADSWQSSFCSPPKQPSSHVGLGRHQSEALSLSQELLHSNTHACSGSILRCGPGRRSSASGGHSPWPCTPGTPPLLSPT